MLLIIPPEPIMNEPRELKRFYIEGCAPGPHLLITGGVHGDEFEPMAAIRRVHALCDPRVLRGRLTLVPVVNEAAFRLGRRCADDGLDLARVCPGRPDGSITERTAHLLSALIRSADFYIDLHTGGTALAVLPLAGYTLHPDMRVLERQREMARAFNLPVVWGTAPTLDGRSLSVARDAGVPAIYAEYYGGAHCDPQGVDDYVAGCFNVLALLGMLDRTPPASRVQHVVEDPRPDSGHMQRWCPAPTAGFFEPAVTLGQPVEQGQRIGCIVDPLAVQRHEIVAPEQGLVLVLRTFASVAPGDSLAVILGLGQH
jgi:predicted deacylase